MFAERRRRFMDRMGDGVALFFAAPEKTRSNDTSYKFRQDSYFHYLTGFNEPEGVLVLLPGHPEHETVMFVRPRDKDKETWNGRRAGPEGAKERFGADAAYTIDRFPELLPGYLENAPSLYHALGRYPDRDQQVVTAMDTVRGKIRQGIKAPATLVDPASILNEMRLRKTPEELERMRRAAVISREAHREAMRSARPGMREYELEAVIEYVFRRNGAAAPGYGTIVGSGMNATILHYVENEAEMKDGDLVLIDAGAEVEGYSADITRTFPVNGKFSPAQREIYEIVLDAQLKAIEQSRLGNEFEDVHQAALRALVEGLIRVGVVEGTADEVIEKETYKPHFMHRTSHWLGLDVHDVGDYRNGEAWRKLETGMVLTVEPGLYFGEFIENCPERYRGIGVRIEDDVLITESGPEVLTAGTPKTVEEVEATMAEAPREVAEPARV
jgi:Xaa-Pro aminopeptidase